MIFCTSQVNGSSKIFPLVKKRSPSGGIGSIQSMYLIQKKAKNFEFEAEKSVVPSANVLNHAFYVNSSEYGEYNDNLCLISDRSI